MITCNCGLEVKIKANEDDYSNGLEYYVKCACGKSSIVSNNIRDAIRNFKKERLSSGCSKDNFAGSS